MIETYAPYVWSCYGVTIAVAAMNVWLARRTWRQQLVAARRRLQIKAAETSTEK